MQATKAVLVKVPIDEWRALRAASGRKRRGMGRILYEFARPELRKLPPDGEPIETREFDEHR
jgi:hypothetical protein